MDELTNQKIKNLRKAIKEYKKNVDINMVIRLNRAYA
jgi:hypothetical protein